MVRRIINSTKQKVVVGSIRQNQMITSFGIGSMIDFIDQTVMIMGTQTWEWASAAPNNPYRINNKNLEGYLSSALGRRINYFIRPRTETPTNFWSKEKSKDIQATIFPTMLYCTHCKKLVNKREKFLSKNKYMCRHVDTTGKVIELQMVPSRFVAVCSKGHIEDFPYSWWVHEGAGKTFCDQPKLRMYYVDNKTDMEHLYVECMTCHERRSMKNASAVNALSHYPCKGNRPWLGDHDPVECDGKLKMSVRNECNVYFPCCISALTIPPWSTKLVREIERYIGVMTLSQTNKIEILNKIYQLPGLEGISIDSGLKVFEKIESKKNDNSSMQEVMEDEYSALSSEFNSDSELFQSHEETVPDVFSKKIEKVLAIDRLTVVTAMVGFSRLEAKEIGSPDLAPLSRNGQEWLPAVEQKGEGIFIKFRESEIDKWVDSIGTRYSDMSARLTESIYDEQRFSPRYVMLHTFAHLFIREIGNRCGYSATSMKERIYSTYRENGTNMAGVLIYTSSADSEGSLGGLVEQAKEQSMRILISAMLERAKWCSSDPVCVSSKEQGVAALNYAACYACTLLPETSCEFRNILLDRVSIVGSLKNKELGFFTRR